MHDLDRTQLEMESDAFESDYEFGDGYETGDYEYEVDETGSPFSEEEEMELAAQMLEITEEGELDQFLGSLIKKAGRAAKRFVRSDVGRALGGILKGAAKKALPIVGRAVGGYFGGPAGAQYGAKLASGAGRFFGLELEGLSMEDQEFEVARRMVRLAGASAKQAAIAPPAASPQAAAQQAVAVAAQRHAPGFLRGVGGGTLSVGAGRGHSGRWIRRGRRIILFGV